MPSSTISRLPALMLLLLQLLPLAVHSRSSVPLLKVQLHEQRISEHKDSGYVRQIMRQAKAAEMRNYMQQDADACDNFFEFACGNWKKIYPDDGPIAKETNFFELLTDTYTKKQSKYLEQGKQQNDTTAETKVKDYYASCMQSGGRNKLQQYKMKLREIIAEFGVMPALVKEEIWQEAVVKFDWLETIAKIQNKYGFDIILQLSIRRDFNNRTLNKLFIGPPSLFLQTKSMYQNAETNYHRKQYEKAIKKNLLHHLDMPDELASVTASDILAFETKLAEGLPSLRTDKTLKSKSVSRTLDEIQSAYAPTFDLKQYLVTALSHEPNATFYEYNAQYQENLVQVIQNSNKEQLANYIYYQLLVPFFYNVEDTAVRRKKVCFEKTLTSFAKVLDSAIFKRYNTAATERDVNLIWQMIKETFLEELESDKLHWISTNTRKLAAEKLQAMQLEINSYAQQDLNAEYAELNIDNRNFIQNLKAVRSFETKRFLKSLYEVPKPTESALMLSYSPAYLSVENLIKIPVSLLQPNYLWSDHYPNALKFGTLGYLIAHELIHGFDDLGRNYDIDGNDFNWWDTNSTEAFNERKQCFKSQYARYRYGGKYLPESDLQAENIADNGAIQVAFRAYMRWLNAAEAQLSSTTTNDTVSVNSTTTPTTSKQSFIIERLPNLNFTNKQLFFISFAQFWCNDINDLLKDKVSLNDVHAPAMFRVIGPLANFIEFSKQFQCAKGTTMNPEKKCQIY